MAFEGLINEPNKFDVRVSRDSESEIKPTLLISYGDITFEVKGNILNHKDFSIKVLSYGHDRSEAEIETLKAEATEVANQKLDELNEKFSELF